MFFLTEALVKVLGTVQTLILGTLQRFVWFPEDFGEGEGEKIQIYIYLLVFKLKYS